MSLLLAFFEQMSAHFAKCAKCAVNAQAAQMQNAAFSFMHGILTFLPTPFVPKGHLLTEQNPEMEAFLHLVSSTSRPLQGHVLRGAIPLWGTALAATLATFVKDLAWES